jgi:hypothetical protein
VSVLSHISQWLPLKRAPLRILLPNTTYAQSTRYHLCGVADRLGRLLDYRYQYDTDWEMRHMQAAQSQGAYPSAGWGRRSTSRRYMLGRSFLRCWKIKFWLGFNFFSVMKRSRSAVLAARKTAFAHTLMERHQLS